MKDKTIWLFLGLGALVAFIVNKGGLSAITGKRAATVQPGVAPAWNLVTSNPTPDNVAAAINAGSSSLATFGNSLKNLFGGSGSATTTNGVPLNISQADVQSALNAPSNPNWYNSADMTPEQSALALDYTDYSFA